MVVNIIMAVTMIPTMLIMCVMWRSFDSRQNGYTFGIRLSKELEDSDLIKNQQVLYRKRNTWLTILIFMMVPIPFFVEHVSIQITFWMVWLLFGILIINYPYVLANKAVKAYKQENCSSKQSVNISIQYVELKVVRTLRVMDMLPELLVSVLLIGLMFVAPKFGWCNMPLDRFILYRNIVTTFALCTPAFALTAWFMDRLRGEVISADSNINTAYTRTKKNQWRRIWIQVTWLHVAATAVIAGAALADVKPGFMLLVSVILESVAAIVILFRSFFTIREIDKMYESKRDPFYSTDEEDHWYWWGMFYYNPKDRRSFVEKRFGIGTTMNMATKGGKICGVIGFLALAWIPIMCGWLIAEDFTPIHVQVHDNAIICSHLKEDYQIPLDEVTEVQLLNELPSDRSKRNGTGTNILEKGKWVCNEYGLIYEFLNPENSKFLLVQTGDSVYLIGGNNDNETMEIYQQVK